MLNFKFPRCPYRFFLLSKIYLTIFFIISIECVADLTGIRVQPVNGTFTIRIVFASFFYIFCYFVILYKIMLM
jgi:hypothetical protein